MVSRLGMRGPPPLHLWNPPYCGEIDIRIAGDGTWFHEGTPISRPAMVQLFASILICEETGRYFLITPVEKVGLKVDDVPFQAVSLDVEAQGTPEQCLSFTTNVGDRVRIGAECPLRFATDEKTLGLKPYILVRDRLEALVNRATTYDLVGLGETETVDGTEMFGVRSGGLFFPMAPANEIKN